MFADLIGLPYQWGAKPSEGATDCLMLSSEIRRRLGMPSYDEQYQWIYEKWDGDSFPSKLVLKWLRLHGQLSEPRLGAVACLPDKTHGFALGTMDSDESLIFIAPGERVTRVPVRLLSDIRFYQDKRDD
jgi:hypothetical protein